MALFKKTVNYSYHPYFNYCTTKTVLNHIGVSGNKINKTYRRIIPVASATYKVFEMDAFKNAPGVNDWIKKIIDYNMRSSKMIRSTIAVHAYQTMVAGNVTEHTLRNVHMLGFCTELVHSYFVILDDIVDRSLTRGGQPCWYRSEDVGLSAVNDASLIRSFLYAVLRENFGANEHYGKIVQLFDEAFLHTAMGQYLDTSTSKKKDYSLFTIDHYDAIVKYKTAHYSIKLPIMLGAVLTNQLNIRENNIDEVVNNIGKIFQMLNDFEDCYRSSIAGKEGTDIQEGKCSWLAIKALQRCNASQRVVFKNCYGSNQPAHIERIKRLYDELKLPEIYKKERRELTYKIAESIKALQNNRMENILADILTMIMNTEK